MNEEQVLSMLKTNPKLLEKMKKEAEKLEVKERKRFTLKGAVRWIRDGLDDRKQNALTAITSLIFRELALHGKATIPGIGKLVLSKDKEGYPRLTLKVRKIELLAIRDYLGNYQENQDYTFPISYEDEGEESEEAEDTSEEAERD